MNVDKADLQEALITVGMPKDQAEKLAATTTDITFKSSGADCPYCDGDGWIHHINENGNRSCEKCQCRIAKEAVQRIKNSGLGTVLDAWTLDAFKTEQPYQQTMKDTAQRYAQHIQDGGDSWLYMGGQVGCGKSHLCTAVCGELLKTRFPVRYMRWVTASGDIKRHVNDPDAFSEILDPLKTAKILFVDDLFKMQHRPGDKPRPTDADVKIAFELFDYRYAERKPTIITSEWMLSDELMDIDAGTFSRVYEMAKGFLVEIAPEMRKNYRTKG